jgi:hypothetical protein
MNDVSRRTAMIRQRILYVRWSWEFVKSCRYLRVYVLVYCDMTPESRNSEGRIDIHF